MKLFVGVAAVILFSVLLSGGRWLSRVALVADCKLIGIKGSVELGTLFRVYRCEDGIGVLVPAGKFPRVSGPGEDLPI